MDAVRLALGIALPWLAGYALVRAATSRLGTRDAWADAGYGHFAGILVVTLLLRANDVAGMPLSALPVAVALLVIAAAGFLVASRTRIPAHAPIATDAHAWRWLTYAAIALIALRVGTLAADVLLRPLFAWDAWAQWGTKAKVWSGLRDIVPFIGSEDWILQRRSGYTDTAPNYPATLPLLQTWMTLVLGRWDDALMNVPWLAAFVALGAGVYGQLSRLGIARPWAALSSYLVLSLPLVGTHVALAGYADLHVAAAYALGILALAEWERTRDHAALARLATVAVMLPLFKIPGVAWLGTLALGVVVAAFGTTLWRMLLLGAGVLACTVAAGLYVSRGKAFVDAAATQYKVAESLMQHLYAFGNWHLLWYLLPLVVVVAWREALVVKATSIALACGLAFLVWTFLFTQAGDWVVDYTTVNRALLHIAPAITAFTALLAYRWARRREEAIASTAPLAAG
jgi:hypothetical protein